MCVPVFCGLSELTTLKEAKINIIIFVFLLKTKHCKEVCDHTLI